MLRAILFTILIVPFAVNACEWKVQVTDLNTNEQKHYLVSASETTNVKVATNFTVGAERDKNTAYCVATLESVSAERRKKDIVRSNVAELKCAYGKDGTSFSVETEHSVLDTKGEIPGIPRLVRFYTGPVHLILYDDKIKRRFLLRLSCE